MLRILVSKLARQTVNACGQFNKLAGLALTVDELPESWRGLDPTQIAFLLVAVGGEGRPGSGDADLRDIAERRAEIPGLAATPIVFLASNLSPTGVLAAADMEFAHVINAPFTGKAYLEAARKILSFITNKAEQRHQRIAWTQAFERGDFTACKQIAPKLAPLYDDPDLRLRLLQWSVLRAERHHESALKLAEEAVKLGPESLRAHEQLLTCLDATATIPQHQAAVAAAMKLAGEHPEFLVAQGNARLNQRDAASALRSYTNALARNPSMLQARWGVIAATLATPGAKLAIPDLEVVRNDHSLLTFCDHRATMMAMGGGWQQAAALLRGILRFYPVHSVSYRIWMNLGVTLLHINERAEAVKALQRCQSVAPPVYDRPAKLLARIAREDQEAAALAAKASA